jgi:hypothetical protein
MKGPVVLVGRDTDAESVDERGRGIKVTKTLQQEVSSVTLNASETSSESKLVWGGAEMKV